MTDASKPDDSGYVLPSGWKVVESKSWGRAVEDTDGEWWYGCAEHDLYVAGCDGCRHANHECEGVCHP